jgi:hypothetical protein
MLLYPLFFYSFQLPLSSSTGGVFTGKRAIAVMEEQVTLLPFNLFANE